MNEHSSGWSRRGLLFTGAGLALTWRGLLQTSRAQTTEATVSASSLSVPELHCVLSSEFTVGPYYIDSQMVRRDITEGRPGIPLKLRVTIMDVKRCRPIPNAALDIWHCDATGVYSGFTAQGSGRGFGPPPDGAPNGRANAGRPDMGPPPDFGPGGPPPGGPGGPGGMRKPTDKSTFFRGVQLSNSSGIAEIDTIYPGGYAGRDTHIHVRVHIGGKESQAKYQGGHVAHTGQLFFPDDLTDKIAFIKPYSASHIRRLRNEEDGIFLSDHKGGTLVPEAVKPGSLTDGFVANAVVGIDPDATPSPAGFGGGPPMPRGPGDRQS